MNDAATFASAAGLQGVNGGDQVADAKVVRDYINAHGGVLDRKLVTDIYDVPTADAVSNPSGTAQRVCDYFLNDRRVAMVFNNTLTDIPESWNCWRKAGVPFFSALGTMIQQKTLNEYFPYLYAMIDAQVESYFPALLDRQQARGYFTPWDNQTGAPGKAPVRVGFLYSPSSFPNDPGSYDVLERLLKARKIPVAVKATYQVNGNLGADFTSAILRFKQAGVTHLYLSYSGGASIFMQTAESQQFRPRYTAWSFLNAGGIQSNAPRAQLHGMLGAGYLPSFDVDAANHPGAFSTGVTLCRDIYRKAGLPYTAGSQAEFFAFSICDGLRMFTAAANAVGSAAASELRTGMNQIGPSFPSSLVFKNGFGPSRSDQASAVRDHGFVDECACFRYLSKTSYPS